MEVEYPFLLYERKFIFSFFMASHASFIDAYLGHPSEHTHIIPESQLLQMQSILAHGSICEHLVFAIAQATYGKDLQKETILKMPGGSISILPFVLHLSVLIFTEGQVQESRIQ